MCRIVAARFVESAVLQLASMLVPVSSFFMLVPTLVFVLDTGVSLLVAVVSVALFFD